MTLMTCQVGENLLVDKMFHSSSGENLLLKLYSNNYTPTNTDTAGSYTEATFTGYSAITLTNSSWSSASTVSSKASTSYAQQTWTATSSQTIYGYYVVGATSTTLYFAEAFSAGKPLTSGDEIQVTPVFTLDHT